MATDGDTGEAFVEVGQAITEEILDLLEPHGPAWDTYATVVEVDDDTVAASAWLYGDGAARFTEPCDSELFWDLRDASRGHDGSTWDAVVIKIRRSPGAVAMDFLSGADADAVRITPDNVYEMGERMRPGPETFDEPAG